MILRRDYDFNRLAEDVANERGQVVVLPRANQLQIDLDTEEAYEEFRRRLSQVSFPRDYFTEVKPSASGLPHRHVTLTFLGQEFTEAERIALQAGLGDDPLRVWMNMRRLVHGTPNPTRFFEDPPPVEDCRPPAACQA